MDERTSIGAYDTGGENVTDAESACCEAGVVREWQIDSDSCQTDVARCVSSGVHHAHPIQSSLRPQTAGARMGTSGSRPNHGTRSRLGKNEQHSSSANTPSIRAVLTLPYTHKPNDSPRANAGDYIKPAVPVL